jgi:CBS-domain-containing membrane protein
MDRSDLPAAEARLAWRELLGIAQGPVSHREAVVSGLGGCAAIVAVLLVSGMFVGADSAALLVASMGASAVLLFAVPHGGLSQPWAVVGGHVCSAVVGSACAMLIGPKLLAAALAVGLAIGVMQLMRCIHPPGGATALSAVIGGPGVHALGFGYVFTPVLLNAAVIVLVAVAFNGLFGWRRYPAALAAREK